MTFEQSAFPSLIMVIGLMTLQPSPLAQAAEEWTGAERIQVEQDTEIPELPASITVEPTGDGNWACTFMFQPKPDAKAVSLAGTFNDWNATTNPMKGPRGDGYWAVTVNLSPGIHQYKFVVEGNEWHQDPKNMDGIDDNNGGDNSVLRLGRAATLRTSDSKPGDSQIDGTGLIHDPKLPFYFQALSMDEMLLRYQTYAHDVQHVWVAMPNQDMIKMHRIERDSLFDTYELRVKLPPTESGYTRDVVYTFVVQDGDQRYSHFKDYYRTLRSIEIFHTPDWAKNAIWYQIMTDRFRNGDPSNDPPRVHPWTSDWFKAQPWEAAREGQSFYHWFVFDRKYGGDIAGIREKLPYLKELGVNALYLMPMFIAESNHKYNTTNYLHIDPWFGAGAEDDYEQIVATEDLKDPKTWKWTKSDKMFLDFIKEAHEAGFKIIIDGVFNHVGTDHPAFQDVRKNGRESRYAEWFDVTSWDPFHYEGWGGFDALPEFKKSSDGLASESVTKHIMDVTERWMDPDGDGDPSDGIDGWRLDVPNEIPGGFWVKWRQHVKNINREAYITAEIWDRADQWLTGRHYDAVMNYQFARAVIRWAAFEKGKISPSELDRRLQELRMAYPLEATLALQNLMNSHDTDRLVSMVFNKDRDYDQANRVQDNGPDYSNAKPPAESYRRARLIALLQMTYVGAPMVWYGDEQGMWGADDPTCRKPMLWEDLEPYEKPEENAVMPSHRAFYRSAIALRNAYPALRTGGFETLLTDDEQDVWVFRRFDESEELIVVLNASTAKRTVRFDLPEEKVDQWKVVFGLDKSFLVKGKQMQVTVPGIDGVVIRAEHAASTSTE
jgi:cyclomaltodextrinase